MWKSIIANFKAAGPQVTVLGSVGAGTTTSDYATLGDPGVGWKDTLCADTNLCDGTSEASPTQRGAAGAAVDGFSKLLI